MTLAACPECGKGISTDPIVCPACGHRLRRTVAVKVGIVLATVIAVVVGLAIFGLILGRIHQNDAPPASSATAP